VVAQENEEEDPTEEALEQSRAWNEAFQGKTPVIPYGGLDVRTEKGTYHILSGTEIGPLAGCGKTGIYGDFLLAI